MPASPQNSSSYATGMPSPDSSKNCVAKKSSEYSPILAASCRIGQGVCSRSSQSAAAGRITDAANSCTQSRMSRRSRLSSSENAGLTSVTLLDGNINVSAAKVAPRVNSKKFVRTYGGVSHSHLRLRRRSRYITS